MFAPRLGLELNQKKKSHDEDNVPNRQVNNEKNEMKLSNFTRTKTEKFFVLKFYYGYLFRYYS